MRLFTAKNQEDYPHQTEVNAELVHLLYHQAKPALLGSIAVATFLVYGLYGVIANTTLEIWYLLILLMTTLRYRLIKMYLTTQPPIEKSGTWKRTFLLMAFYSGITWALAGTWLLPNSDLHQAVIACALAGVTAGAIPYFSGSRLVCIAFIGPILLAFSLGFFHYPDKLHTLLGILTLLYLALLCISSFRTHRAIFNSIKLKFENIELVKNLSMAKKETEIINQELQEEINERKIIEKKLRESEEYLATHDALTHLPNRHAITTRLSQILKNAQHSHKNVALLLLDLDHFKNINDSLGHDIGDQLLIQVAARIRHHLRNTDTLGRLGGDEFIVIAEDMPHEDVVALAEKLHHLCTLPFHINDQATFITTSIGISLYPEHGEDLQLLLKNADMAIYQAKEKGRNTFAFYTGEMNEKMQKKSTIANHLRHVLEKNELIIYYQPLVNISQDTTVGFEALLRWKHPQLGFIPPSEFIPIAEETGFIIPISEWVLQGACLQYQRWKERCTLSAKFRLSINLSARQFKEPHLLEKIQTILHETGAEGKSFTFELTESLIMQNVEYSEKVMKSLKNMGIAISIDDFGTGYSSLNYLRRFPIDVLKIDRSFITDVVHNDDDATIVKTIIAMAHSLKMKVVAEGVEHLDQYEFLKNLECDEIQGYLISPPVPPEKLETLLQDPFYIKTQLETHGSMGTIG